MGRFYNTRGMSSLLGNDFVNILTETNTDNNSEYKSQLVAKQWDCKHITATYNNIQQ
jgi:hypothetical protein